MLSRDRRLPDWLRFHLWQVAVLTALATVLRLVPWVAAPSNLTAAIVDGEGVVINWTAPTEDAEAVTGYQILCRRPLQGEHRLLVHVDDTGPHSKAHGGARQEDLASIRSPADGGDGPHGLGSVPCCEGGRPREPSMRSTRPRLVQTRPPTKTRRFI